MAIVNDDVILAILGCCDIFTVLNCRVVSSHFKHLIDEDLALNIADFSTIPFRQRRNITDSTMKVLIGKFEHLFRRTSVVNLNGTGIGHYGAMKLVTDMTKELHIERCPHVDLAKLIQAIAGQRWISWELGPVHLYAEDRSSRGIYNPLTIIQPLYEYTWGVVLMSNDCGCRYTKVEEYPPHPFSVVPCHACDKDVKHFTLDTRCISCTFATCQDCKKKVCSTLTCTAAYCKGCAIEHTCSLCCKERCQECSGIVVFQCYGCSATICSECQPSTHTCSSYTSRMYCAPCMGAMVGEHGHWCCEAGNFIARVLK